MHDPRNATRPSPRPVRQAPARTLRGPAMQASSRPEFDLLEAFGPATSATAGQPADASDAADDFGDFDLALAAAFAEDVTSAFEADPEADFDAELAAAFGNDVEADQADEAPDGRTDDHTEEDAEDGAEPGILKIASLRPRLDVSSPASPAAQARLEAARALVAKALEAQRPLRPLLAKAIVVYGEAMALCPDLSEPYLAIAWLSLRAGLCREAATVLDQGLQVLPDEPRLLAMLEQARQQHQEQTVKTQVQTAARQALERKR